MLNNKYFEIVKCTAAQAWKLRFWVVGLSALLSALILYSPFKPLFIYLGYADSTGCPFYTLTGIPCPTCGMGRGFASLIHFDYAHLFYHNPSSVFFYLPVILITAAIFILSFFNYKVSLKKTVFSLWLHFIILVAIVWILNIIFGHHAN